MRNFSVQRLYIGGGYVDASSGETFETINPASSRFFADVPHRQAKRS